MAEPNVHIFRSKPTIYGTEGFLYTANFSCYTLELPWKDNQPNISCIPKGEYEVVVRNSPRFGKVYHVTEVKNRQHILIHAGNLAGDESKGLKTHVKGCILLGKYRGILEKQRAVLCSRPTVRAFMNALANNPFKLSIYDALGEEETEDA